jgi:chromate transporter
MMALPEKPPLDPPAPRAKSQVSLSAIYKLFFFVGLYSFGGGLSGWLHREVVSNRGWLTDDEFFSGYSMINILPGVNSSNLSVYIGQHLRGAAGAATALLALLTAPFVIVIATAIAYQHLLQVPGFEAAVVGIAAAAIGMLVRFGFVAARRTVTSGVIPTLIFAAVFAAIGIMRWPLWYVVLAAVPISIGLTAWTRKRKTDA